MVSYYFPPIGGIGSIRSAGFARHLPEMGWVPTVLAPKETPHASDLSLSVEGVQILRARSFEISRRARASGGRADTSVLSATNDWARSVLAHARGAAHRFAVFPDAQIGWYPGAVAAGLRAVREQPFDAVFSSSFPITAHLVARSVSAHAGLPWIAEFRDPWSDRLPRIPYRRQAERIEYAIARRADRVIMPSRTLAHHFGRRWAVDLAAIPHGADGSPVLRSQQPTPPVLAHVGSYYPGRQSLLAVWRALGELRAEGAALPRILWVGPLPAEARAELARYGVEDIVEVTGFVPQRVALQLLRASSMLLASGQLDRGPLGRGTSAAKLVEYLASGLPVLFVGDPAGDAAQMLAANEGCHVIDFDDVGGARRALQSGLTGEVHRRDVEYLGRRARARELADILDMAAGTSRGRGGNDVQGRSAGE